MATFLSAVDRWVEQYREEPLHSGRNRGSTSPSFFIPELPGGGQWLFSNPGAFFVRAGDSASTLSNWLDAAQAVVELRDGDTIVL